MVTIGWNLSAVSCWVRQAKNIDMPQYNFFEFTVPDCALSVMVPPAQGCFLQFVALVPSYVDAQLIRGATRPCLDRWIALDEHMRHEDAPWGILNRLTIIFGSEVKKLN